MVNAKDILYISEKREKVDSKIISKNVEKLLIQNGYETREEQIKILAEITGSSLHACHAWLNMSRESVKIPLIKLCMIAAKFNADIEKIMEE